MKFSIHARSRAPSPDFAPALVAVAPPPAPAARAREAPTLATVVASSFGRLHVAHRARVLRRLLLPVGPLALAVLCGGAFRKFAGQARWARMHVSLEDAARVTSSQIRELVRYVEQSNPAVLQQVMVVLARGNFVQRAPAAVGSM